MNTRKRPASVAFPSSQSPNKVQRRQSIHSPSSTATSSHIHESIGARWKELTSNLFSLISDTVSCGLGWSMFHSDTLPQSVPNFASDSNSSSSENSSQPSSSASEEVVLSLQSPPSAVVSPRQGRGTSSLRSSLQPHSRRSSILIGTQGITKSSKRRPHIHMQQHQAATKDRLKMELYNLERAQGYSSDFQTFKSYLDYRHQVEQVTSSTSVIQSGRHVLGNIRGNASTGHTLSEPINTTALRLALVRARDSLKGPGPAKPFIPTFDQLQIADKRTDRAIDKRIRQPLPEKLPPAAQALVSQIMSNPRFESKAGRELVAYKDLQRLRPNQWLNDELINFYGQLIVDRSLSADAGKENVDTKAKSEEAKHRKPLLKVHYFNTFFWPKVEAGYAKSNLRKWTKKVDVFSKDVVLIPINHNQTHWSAAAINFKRKRVEAYDSLNPDNSRGGIIFDKLREYIQEEHRDKKGKDFDFTGWVNYGRPDTPQQENGFDCGVFTTQFLESVARGEDGFSFSQKDAPYLRQRMIWEIGRAKMGDDR